MLKNKGEGTFWFLLRMKDLLVQARAFANVLDWLIIYLTRLPTSLHGYDDHALIKEVPACSCSLAKLFFSSISFNIIQSEVYISKMISFLLKNVPFLACNLRKGFSR